MAATRSPVRVSNTIVLAFPMLAAHTREPSGEIAIPSVAGLTWRVRTARRVATSSSVTVPEPTFGVQTFPPPGATARMCVPRCSVGTAASTSPRAKSTRSTARLVSDVTASRASPGRKAMPCGRRCGLRSIRRAMVRAGTSITVSVLPMLVRSA